jgi:hypothetical protein
MVKNPVIIPFRHDTGHFLIRLLMVMVALLMVVSLDGWIIFSDSVSMWKSRSPEGCFVAWASPQGKSIEKKTLAQTAEQILKGHPYVKNVQPLNPLHMAFRPYWHLLGNNQTPDLFLDVTLSTQNHFQLENLVGLLDDVLPGVYAHAYGPWSHQIIQWGEDVKKIMLFSFIILAIFGWVAIGLSVSGAFRLHQNYVRTLHLLGASDQNIMEQFSAHTLSTLKNTCLISLCLGVFMTFFLWLFLDLNSGLYLMLSPFWVVIILMGGSFLLCQKIVHWHLEQYYKQGRFMIKTPSS